jgi:two-component system, chemotaxis family, protein-glutamate methylesterase/glutaminase
MKSSVPPKHIVVIGASSGGIEALRTLAAGLPAEFPAPICVVMHVAPESPGLLAQILARAGALPAVNAHSGERVERGRIYVAPPDCHLLVEPGRLRVTKGPRENRFRPAIDPLFRSAAQVYGPNAIGVILTGLLGDGTAGLWAVKQLGGTAIVQDPADAVYPDMPTNALQHVKADHVVSLAAIAPLLVQLTSVPAEETGAIPVPDDMNIEVNIAKEQNALDAGLERIATPSSYACPECHGVLLQLKEGDRIRFRCHTGHAYSVDSLLTAIDEGIEESLWNAVRSLEEGRLLLEQLASHLAGAHKADATGLAARADKVRRQCELIRNLVREREPLVAKS